jgi:hypothetical protein
VFLKHLFFWFLTGKHIGFDDRNQRQRLLDDCYGLAKKGGTRRAILSQPVQKEVITSVKIGCIFTLDDV